MKKDLGRCCAFIKPGTFEAHRCTSDAVRKVIPPNETDAAPFCRLHADMFERHAAKLEKQREKHEAAQALREERAKANAELDNLALMLGERWGFTLTACHYPYANSGIVISPEDAKRLLEYGYDLAPER